MELTITSVFADGSVALAARIALVLAMYRLVFHEAIVDLLRAELDRGKCDRGRRYAKTGFIPPMSDRVWSCFSLSYRIVVPLLFLTAMTLLAFTAIEQQQLGKQIASFILSSAYLGALLMVAAIILDILDRRAFKRSLEHEDS